MLSMFKPAKIEEKKVVITEFNDNLHAMFEQFFTENYQSARMELLENGVPEESVDQKLSEIKQATQQRMLIEAQRLLKEELLILAKKNTSFKLTDSHANDVPDNSVKMSSTSL